MTATALAIVPSELPNPVVPYVEANPVSVLTDKALRERFFTEIELAISEFEPDLKTAKGRKAIASFAHKFSRTKTAIDDAGQALNDDANKQISAVNLVRRECRAKLDAMRDLARKPLDEWEAAEAAREALISATNKLLSDAMIILAADTSTVIRERIDAIEAVADDEAWAAAKESTILALRAAFNRIVKDEADRAELAKLRAEEAARKREEEVRLAAEQKARDDAERAEHEERAVQERIAAAKLRAVQEAEEAINAAAQAEAKRIADEEEARKKNREHVSAVMSAAKVAVMSECGLDEEAAKSVIKAIFAGRIPSVSIQF